MAQAVEFPIIQQQTTTQLGEQIAELLKPLPYYSAFAVLQIAAALLREHVKAFGWQSYQDCLSSREEPSEHLASCS
jgi:hypothetical protein